MTYTIMRRYIHSADAALLIAADTAAEEITKLITARMNAEICISLWYTIDMTDYTTEQRIGRKLRRMQHDDSREAQRSTPEGLTAELRTRLNEEFPNATAAQIEAEIVKRLARGSAPTTAVVPPSLGIPQNVQAERRTARKKLVASGKHLRR